MRGGPSLAGRANPEPHARSSKPLRPPGALTEAWALPSRTPRISWRASICQFWLNCDAALSKAALGGLAGLTRVTNNSTFWRYVAAVWICLSESIARSSSIEYYLVRGEVDLWGGSKSLEGPRCLRPSHIRMI